MLPCPLYLEQQDGIGKGPSQHHYSSYNSNTQTSILNGLPRRLMAEESVSTTTTGYCANKGKVPMLSLEAIHHLHIFIFVLAIVHVSFCALTVMFGMARIRQWHQWEIRIEKDHYDAEQALKKKFTHVRDHSFIRDNFLGIGKDSEALGWMQAFLKQFYASVTRTDYLTLRLGFIMTHCPGNPKFNFHKYMMRALEDDFRRVVGISWYLWIFVMVFLLLNVNGWHTYFWIAFIPFILLLAVGTKLEHVICQLAHEVAERHIAIEGALVVQPSDEHFWFSKPNIVLYLIHFILFQNSFEMAFFFWIWVQYGFDSCIMGQVRYIVPRLLIGIFIQVLCSYSTLPLYAIVTQMGSSFKKAIFDEDVQASLADWAARVKRKKEVKTMGEGTSPSPAGFTTPTKLGKLKELLKKHDDDHDGVCIEETPHQGHDRPENAGTSSAATAAGGFEDIQLSPADGKH
ncbi:MLO-like protein 1 [Linum perenne]